MSTIAIIANTLIRCNTIVTGTSILTRIRCAVINIWKKNDGWHSNDKSPFIEFNKRLVFTFATQLSSPSLYTIAREGINSINTHASTATRIRVTVINIYFTIISIVSFCTSTIVSVNAIITSCSILTWDGFALIKVLKEQIIIQQYSCTFNILFLITKKNFKMNYRIWFFLYRHPNDI